MARIQLGKRPSQIPPTPKDPTDQELYDAFKEEMGKPAIYKRNGEWHESKAYLEWRSNFLALQFSELSEDDESTVEETIDMASKMTDVEVKLTEISKEEMKKELDITDIEFDDMEEALGIVKPKRKPKELSEEQKMTASELNAKIKGYQKNMKARCIFLYNLLGSDKIKLVEILTDAEMNYIEEITEALEGEVE